MSETADPLVLDFVEWVAREPRVYAEVVATWRTSCPRLTIWEDASDHGYVTREAIAGFGFTTWRLDGDQLILTGRGGNWRFAESDPTTWERVPLSTDPLLLMK